MIGPETMYRIQIQPWGADMPSACIHSAETFSTVREAEHFVTMMSLRYDPQVLFTIRCDRQPSLHDQYSLTNDCWLERPLSPNYVDWTLGKANV